MASIEPKDIRQAASLVLLSPTTGQPMMFYSKMCAHGDGSFSFLVGNPETRERYRVTVTVEEVPHEPERKIH